MKIGTKLYSNIIILVVFFLILSAVLMWGSRQMDEGMRQGEVADKVIRDIFELSNLTSEVLLHHDEIRPRKQWEDKCKSLTTFLSELELKGEELEEVLDKIMDNLKKIEADYLKFSLLHGEHSHVNEPPEDFVLATDLEVRLVGQLLIHSQDIVSNAFKLSSLSNSRHYRTQQRINLLIMTFTIILIVVLSVISYFINRSVIKPLKRLHKGTEIIGGGDLDYRVEVNSDDEIGQLGNSFNQMIGSLKEEIIERNRAEEELKAANQQLRASEQQLKAANQQLRANEQQLRAEITERNKMAEEREKHMHDLEVFYKANIGREERVLELKKRIKELEGKPGE